MEKTFKDFMAADNLDQLRYKLNNLMIKHCLAPYEVAKHMSVSASTLNRFIQEKGEVSFVTLLKIDSFIQAYEGK